jgi:6-phosphogluconate dehydrogenase (decarboxylating)
VLAAVDGGTPASVLSALFARFAWRGKADLTDPLLSAMRKPFGDDAEITAAGS